MIQYDPPPADLDRILFEEFPVIAPTHTESKIPQMVLKKLEGDIEHVLQQLATVSNTHDERSPIPF